MVVVSDLEGTLTTGATWRGVRNYLQQTRSPLAYRLFFLVHLPSAILAKMGWLDEQDVKAQWMVDQAQLLKHMPEAELLEMAQWICEHELWPKRRQVAVEELLAWREKGKRVILTSGGYEPLVAAFAERIGAEAIGSTLEIAEGHITGRVIGEVNVRQNKANSLVSFLDGDSITAAYGDTASDVPMLSMAEEAVAVAPNDELRAIAVERNWRILEDFS
jgi:phosphoserine phosphatase